MKDDIFGFLARIVEISSRQIFFLEFSCNAHKSLLISIDFFMFGQEVS